MATLVSAEDGVIDKVIAARKCTASRPETKVRVGMRHATRNDVSRNWRCNECPRTNSTSPSSWSRGRWQCVLILRATEHRNHVPSTVSGEVVDHLADTGATKSICRLQHFPGFQNEVCRRKDLSVADGSKPTHWCDTEVQLKVRNEDLRASFHVTDVTQPTLSVTRMNDTGAEVEFAALGTIGLPSITWDSRSGRSRWRRHGKCFLCITTRTPWEMLGHLSPAIRGVG